MARRALSPTCLALVRAVRHQATDAVVRLGVSGGVDSLALAAAAAHAHHEGALPRVEALVVDHGLQPGSDEVAARAAAQVELLGLPARVARVRVGRADGPEAAARAARHEALWREPTAAGGLPAEVWLAHTLDDQAEGVLLGLARGSGPRSLTGMAPRRRHQTPTGGGEVVRPLLGLRRADTRQACADWGLAAWDDPANRDAAFRRSALRSALPVLGDALGVDVAVNLARTADLAREDADLLDELARAAFGRVRDDLGVRVSALAAEPAALRGRVVRTWLLDSGCPEVARRHVDAVLALVERWHGQGPLDLPGGVRVARRDGRLVVLPGRVER